MLFAAGGDIGGGKTHILSLAKELAKDNDLRLVSFRRGVLSQEGMDMGIDTVDTGGNNGIFRSIRLADMMLLYAEVLNEINNAPNAKAIGYVDAVRTRVKLPKLAQSEYYTDPKILTDYKAFKEHLQALEDFFKNAPTI